VSSAENIAAIVKYLLQHGCRPPAFCIPPDQENLQRAGGKAGRTSDTDSEEDESEDSLDDDDGEITMARAEDSLTTNPGDLHRGKLLGENDVTGP
jgi:hypothetical protein